MKFIIYFVCFFVGSAILTVGGIGGIIPYFVVYGFSMLIANKIIKSIEEKKEIKDGKLIICQTCKTLNSRESTYCKNCGEPLEPLSTEKKTTAIEPKLDGINNVVSVSNYPVNVDLMKKNGSKAESSLFEETEPVFVEATDFIPKCINAGTKPCACIFFVVK